MKFSVDARTILRLGRDSIRDHTTAVLELVKNSYDAGASVVEIEIFSNPPNQMLRVADNGSGMSTTELQSNWLRIGFSRKATDRFSENKRRRTGEKGIGRISADRLGSRLQLLTRPASAKPHGLSVNWDEFDIDGKTIDSIDVPSIDASDIKLPIEDGRRAKSGTELRITELRQTWTDIDVEALYSELSLLISPFRTLSDFRVFLNSDAWKKGRVRVSSQFPEHAQLEFKGTFDGNLLSYDISQRAKKKRVERLDRKISWNELVQLIGEQPGDDTVPLGRVEIRLLFFVQQAEVLGVKGFSLSELRTFLQNNAGVRIYRDLVRVKPYGDPKDPQGDWLGLAERRSGDPAGVGRKTYKVGLNQLVGAIFVGRDSNPGIIDSSSREGLVRGTEFYKLRKLVLGSIRLLESYRHESYKAEKNRSAGDAAKEAVGQASSRLSNLQQELRAIKGELPPNLSRSLDRALNETAAISKTVAFTEKSIEELIGQSSLYRGLATIGIASAVFGHETQSAIDEFKMATGAAQAQLRADPPRVPVALKELDKALKYSTRVAAWGAFALARIQYEKRKKRERDLKGLFEDLVQHIAPAFESANIQFIPELASVRTKIFEMDLEAILLNLLTNAYHACQQVARARQVKIVMSLEKVDGRAGYYIAVSDSGPGVAEEYLQKVWEPLFSTKMDRNGKQVGTGLGLTIVKSIADELKGSVSVERDSVLKGARFKVWLPS
jgi:hypothetical protein